MRSFDPGHAKGEREDTLNDSSVDPVRSDGGECTGAVQKIPRIGLEMTQPELYSAAIQALEQILQSVDYREVGLCVSSMSSKTTVGRWSGVLDRLENRVTHGSDVREEQHLDRGVR